MLLTKDALRRAESYLCEHARPLEAALYRHWFAGHAPSDALRELARFQNLDGGFGRGLEPDLRIDASSVIATTVALQHLLRLGVAGDEPLVRGAMGYLAATYDPEIDAWPIIPEHDNTAPHAPWWGYDADLAGRWNGFRANPRAEILGYLHAFRTTAPPGLRDALTPRVVVHLADATETLEMHEILCYVRLMDAPGLPSDTREELAALMRLHVEEAVGLDPGAWDGYALQPLDVAERPDAPLVASFEHELEANLDHVIARQGDDGAWDPAWSWGDAFPEAWAEARRDWKGVLTLRNLLRLRAFGRLDD